MSYQRNALKAVHRRSTMIYLVAQTVEALGQNANNQCLTFAHPVFLHSQVWHVPITVVTDMNLSWENVPVQWLTEKSGK